LFLRPPDVAAVTPLEPEADERLLPEELAA
jgi:hypothetical protein